MTFEGKSQSDDESEGSVDDVFDDIEEALDLARSQDVLPAVRIIKILSGEGTGQFSTDTVQPPSNGGVPLHTALDYIGSILDESSKEISRLRKEIESYSTSCDEMQLLIDNLTEKAESRETHDDDQETVLPKLDIENMYIKLCEDLDNGDTSKADESKEVEEFWREIGQSDGSTRFSVIAKYFGKELIT